MSTAQIVAIFDRLEEWREERVRSHPEERAPRVSLTWDDFTSCRITAMVGPKEERFIYSGRGTMRGALSEFLRNAKGDRRYRSTNQIMRDFEARE